MKTVNMHEAKTTLSKLVEAALAGEQVVIAKAGKPLVRLTPVDADLEARQAQRNALFGCMKGEITFAPDYDEADEEIIADFEASERDSPLEIGDWRPKDDTAA